MTQVVKTVGEHNKSARATSRLFQFRGKTVKMTLTSPYVRNDGLEFDIGAAWVCDQVNPAELVEPKMVRGFYAHTTYEITGLGFPLIRLKCSVVTHKNKSRVEIIELTATGNPDQQDLNLPLERLRIYALNLAGVFGTAYPPNYRKPLTPDGKSWQQFDAHGGLEIDGYGYQLTRATAKDILGIPQTKTGEPLTSDATLRKVAELHKTLPYHGKVNAIAEIIGKSTSNTRRLIELCREPERQYLPPKRKRAKKSPETKTTKRGKK